MTLDVHGIIPPMVTPVTSRRGGVDVPGLDRFTQSLVDGGVTGLFPCSSIGEFSSLSRAERREVIETVVENAEGLPVLAGCGGTCIPSIEGYIEDAADAGADAAVVVTPYYLDTNQDGLRATYEHLADRSPLPIVLYDIPSLTGQHLEVDTVVELSGHDGIVGIKDSSGNFMKHYEFVTATPESFFVLQGISGNALPSLAVGADGLVPGPANAFPAAHAAAYEAHEAGEYGRMSDLLDAVSYAVLSRFDGIPLQCGLKHLVSLSGHDVGPPMLPLPTLTDGQKSTLEAAHSAASDALDARFDLS